jgi:uncharacterized protein (DUF2235 family)
VPKNIVLLSDGTGNSAGKLFRTNVWRLYQALDLSSPGTVGSPQQIAYYDDGVGSSSFKPMALLGGAVGWGLKRNVLDLYTHLCRNFEEGDQIYCFGFSRGAFTIRVLTGFLNNQGLIRADSSKELNRLAAEAFHRYRETYRAPIKVKALVRPMRQMAARAAQRRKRAYEQALMSQNPPIRFVGLWDSVAAYGLPIDELTRAWEFFFPLSVPDRELCANVERACHALALDDARNTFHPVLWNELNLPAQNALTTHIWEERISQVWFTGMHAGVGGGYPEDALANVSLHWIMAEAARLGIRFKPNTVEQAADAADIFGKLYDSRRGLGGAYRYMPRKIAVLANDTDNPRDQVIIKRPKIHESVFHRIAYGPDSYAPIVLPASYAVVDATGAIVDLPESKVGTGLLESKRDANDRAQLQERVWDLVWWRRLVYFSSIFTVGLLVFFPWVFPPKDACEGRMCGLAWLVEAVGALLPAVAAPWVKAYHSQLTAFVLTLIVLAYLLRLGGRLRTRIFDEMRAIWRRPAQSAHFPSQSMVYHIRTNPAYVWSWKTGKGIVLPTIAGVVAAIVVAGLASKGGFELASAAGLVCHPTPSGRLQADKVENAQFLTSDPCWASGVRVREGVRYRMVIRIQDPWFYRGKISSDVHGFGIDRMKAPMHVYLPFRRYYGEPWFKPIARIGNLGSDEYPLDAAEVLNPDESGTTLISEFTARRSGELFLFVNDAVWPAPRALQSFYYGHNGSAMVTIRPARAYRPDQKKRD